MRLLTGLLLVVLSLAPAWAAEDLQVYSGQVERDIFTGGANVEVDAEVRGDVFAAGGSVRLAGAVAQDVFLAGGRITLGSVVGGDAILAGGVITVPGEVGDSLIAGAGSITLDGPVAGKVILAGGQIDIGPQSVVGGQAVLTGGQVVLHGRIAGNLRVSGGRVVILGRVDGDIDANAEKLVLGPDAVVGGSVTLKGPNPPEIADSAQVAGDITHTQRMGLQAVKPVAMAWAATLAVMPFFFCFLLGAAVLLIAPAYAERLTARLRGQPLPSFGLGVLLAFGIPVLLLALMVTIIGIPIAILGGALYILLAMAGLPLAALALSGRWSMRPGLPVSRAKAVGVYALTLLGVFVIALVPFLGFLALWVLWSAGIGAGVLALRARQM